MHHKSIAMRSKQINQLVQPNCKLPSTKFARHWMAGKIWYIKTWTNFLHDYKPPDDNPSGPNKGYSILSALFSNKASAFISLQNLPTSKKIYAELQKSIKRPRGSEAWEYLGYPTPAWENSFKALNPMNQQEKLFRLRHYKIYNQEAKCSFCNCRETQEHIFALCTYAKRVWEILFPTITHKLRPPHPPNNPNHIILGVKGTDKRSTLTKTLISSTIHHLWIDHTDIIHKRINTKKPTQTIASLAIKDFKKAISTHFQIHQRNDTLETFEEKIIIREIASVRNRKLYFEPP